jgi:hypothetical protein
MKSFGRTLVALRIVAIAGLLGLFASVSGATGTPTAAADNSAVITSFNPASAAAGDIVSVYGANFGPTEPSQGFYVSDAGTNWGQAVNAGVLVIDSWSDTEIQFTVPVPSGTGSQWRVRPGTTATFCIASNCNLVGSMGNMSVAAPSGSFTNTNLPINNTDNLSDYYDLVEHVGIAPDTDLSCTSNGVKGMDNSTSGDFYDSNAGTHSLLHPDSGTALTPGSIYTEQSASSDGTSPSGLSYVWPNVASCHYDLIDEGATTQTILMPPNSGETASTTTLLGLMGTGVSGPYSGNATVTYADGSTSNAALDFSDWCGGGASDQTTVDQLKRSDGTATCHVFQRADTLTAGKVVTSITIPNSGGSNLTRMRIWTVSLALTSNGTTKSFPWLLWNHPADITYGTALSSTQLDATAGDTAGDIAGTFAYTENPSGTVLPVGVEQPLTATFTPTDTTHWVSGTSATTAITVTKANQSINFGALANHTYGDAPFQVGATATSGFDVSFTALGPCTATGTNGATITITGVGTCQVFADQSGNGNVNAAPEIEQDFTISPYTPQLSWSQPADIAYGTPVSDAQLDASSDTAGTFSYDPALGTVLGVGSTQPLTATFTPTDATDNVSGEQVSTTINVDQYTPQLSWNTPSAITYGTALSSTQLDAQSDVSGTFAYDPTTDTVLGAGANQLLTATFTPTDTTDDVAGGQVTTHITVNKYTPQFSWSTPSAITYGTALSSTQLNAQSDTAGTFAYNPTTGTVLGAGSGQSLKATFTPSDTTDNVSGGQVSTTITVNKYTPQLSWSTPSAITYGTALSATQLDAHSDTAGTFAYNPTTGTVLNAGVGQTLEATFTPTDTSDYVSGGQTSTTVTVNKYTPQLSWTNPADIVYGTALSATQLDAQSDSAGTFVYNPVSGTILGIGDGQTLHATFTPTNTSNFVSGGQVTASINVKHYAPHLTWNNPSDITYGTALSGIQLDAQSDTAGSFSYNPTSGTVLNAGLNQTLTATFTPTDTVDYVSGETVNASINVNKYTPQLSWSTPSAITYGTALSATQLNAHSDTAGTFAYNPTSGTILGAGSGQSLKATFTPTDATDNVSGGQVSTTITVNKYTPQLSWSTPSAITYGTALSATQLNAHSNTAGTFTYNPTSGTILGAGSGQSLKATFTPTDATDNVSGGQVSTTITVNKHTPVLGWSNPAAIVYGTALSSTQLNAHSDTAGTFAYNPTTGTVLTVGTNQNLTATFTPTDANDNVSGGQTTAKINVTKAPLTITAANQTLHYSDLLPNLSATTNWTPTGFVNGDSASVLTTPPTCAPTTTVTASNGRISVKPGAYAIACSGAAATNYAITYVNGKLTVTKAVVKFINNSGTRFKKGATVKLKVTLENAGFTTQKLNKAPVVLGFKSGKTCKATTNATGWATCKVAAPTKTGSATLTMTYVGNTYYAALSQSATVKITS